MPEASAKPAALTALSGRERPLDGVRGLAIALVLLWHCFYLIPSSSGAVIWNHIAGLGWLGVDLFFVLSGYLITRILLAQRGRSGYFGRFYLRRVFRIFPAYYFVLGLIWLWLLLFPPPGWEGNLLGQWPWFVTYLQNWGMAVNTAAFDWPGVGHFWSLAIEEQFYMLWPAIVMLATGASLRRICVCLIACSIMVKFILAAVHAPWAAVYMVTIGRFEGLAGGALLATLTPAALLRWQPWIVRAGVVGVAGLLALLLSGAMMTSRLTLVWAIPTATAAFVWLLLAVQQHSLPSWAMRVLCNRVLVWLGLYSYGIYLCHYPIHWILRVWMVPVGASPPADNFDVLLLGVVTLIISLVFARLMFAVLEAPALRLRDTLQRRSDIRVRA